LTELRPNHDSSLSLGETSPGFGAVPDNAEHGTDQAWINWIRKTYTPVNHPIATCAMMDRALGGTSDDAKNRAFFFETV